MLHLMALVALQQQPAPAHRLLITPAAPVVTTGDTVRLRAQLVDATGQPVRGARISFVATGYDRRTGAITPGLEAELVAVDRDPLADVGALRDIVLVVNNGKVAVNRLSN